MTPAPYRWNLQIYQGTTFRDSKIWKVGETLGTAVPVDFTNCSARAQARIDVTSNTTLFDLSTPNNGIVLGNVPGEIALYIPHSETKNYRPCKAVWDFEVTFANGDVRRLFYGEVYIPREITRG